MSKTPIAPAVALVEKLIAEQQTLAVAESCTGGLLAGAITDVPGVSTVFLGGIVSYTNEAKSDVLELPECLIEQHGAVSGEVAAAMATAAAEKFGAEYGLATTGYAGPGGGTDDDPVGTVYLGFHAPAGLWACRITFDGNRRQVREAAVAHALEWMLRKLNKYPGSRNGADGTHSR